MARERMITRTVVSTTVDVLVINIDTAETGTKSFVLTQNMVKDEKTMLNNAQKMLEDETENQLWTEEKLGTKRTERMKLWPPSINIKVGNKFTITDVNNNIYEYEVCEIEELKADSVDEMINNNYDLTLFTCTLSGTTRYTIRLNRI